eukprot:scaffold141961_cov12-Tisochrysis_lutea.AAC.1
MKLLGIPLNGKKAGAAPGVQPDKDIFNRFAEGIRRLNMPLTQIFQRNVQDPNSNYLQLAGHRFLEGSGLIPAKQASCPQ